MIPPGPPISVITPVERALNRVKLVLFQPFDLAKWFVVGFCAWLAGLGENAFNTGYNFKWPGGQGRPWPAPANEIHDFLMNNLVWIVPLAVVVIVSAVAIGLLLMWLSSRGRFMFLDCIVHNRGQVAAPWNAFQKEGNSLFVFRLIVGLTAFILCVPLLAVAAILMIKGFQPGPPAPALWVALGFIGILLVALGFVFFLIGKLTKDFVVPIMFIRRCDSRAGWTVLGGLLAANPLQFILYILFQILLGIAELILILVGVVVTCCIFGCLMAIPYIGTVVLLPLLTFNCSYSVYYLKQFGPGLDAFAERTG